MSYLRFGAMIVTASIVMFGLMYLNSYAFAHNWFSQTRAWIAVMMGAGMAIVMMLFMRPMYRSGGGVVVIILGSATIFAGALVGP